MDFNELIKRDDLCEALAEGICSACGHAFSGHRILEGSTILFQINRYMVLKIFSRKEPEFCRNEAQYLELLRNRLSVKTPELVSTGFFDGYPYIIMTKMTGLPLKNTWGKMIRRDRELVMEQTAGLLRELHSIPVNEVSYREPEWEIFIRDQIINLETNHLGYGIDQSRLEQIVSFISNSSPVEETAERVICHTEIMKEHLFVNTSGGFPELSGLIDFEPSMVAVPEYDMCAVGLFLSSGEKRLFRIFLDAYGYTGQRESIMRMLLLHRYSNMKWFISTVPAEVPAETVENLCEYWYG